VTKKTYQSKFKPLNGLNVSFTSIIKIVGSAELLLRTCEEVALVLKNHENFSILFFGFSVFFCSRLNAILNS